MNQPQQSQGMGPSKPGVIAPWLLITFIIVLVGGGGYLGWWYYSNHKTTTTTTPTTTTTTPSTTTTTPSTTTSTTSTADWKTYTNDTYKFSLKYPTDLTKSEDKGTNPSEPNQLSWVEFTNTTKYGTAAIVIEVSKNTYTDISDWATKMNNDGIGSGAYTVRNVTIGGIAGKELSTAIEGGAIRTGFIKGDNLYIIHQIGTVASWTDLKNTTVLTEVYNQIISTFQFTK